MQTESGQKAVLKFIHDNQEAVKLLKSTGVRKFCARHVLWCGSELQNPEELDTSEMELNKGTI